MSPDEILSAYNVLTQEVKDYAASEAAKIGNSQRSLGVLAERVASPSRQTSGLANYTYNRTMRPALDASVAQLTTQGKYEALQKDLADKLRAAKNNYEDAQNRYTTAATAPKTGVYSEGQAKDTTSGGTTAGGKTYTSTVVQSVIPYGEIDGVIYLYNPDTGNVVINGQELNMTPKQYADSIKPQEYRMRPNMGPFFE